MATENGAGAQSNPKPAVEVTPEKFQELQTKLQETANEFAQYREQQKAIRDEVRTNSEKRFFKEGASKVENELRTSLEIENDVTGKELIDLVAEKLKGKAKANEQEINTVTADKLKTLEEALQAKTTEFETFKTEISKTSARTKLESFANSILNTGDYKLSEDANVNAKRLQSAISLNSDLQVDYSGAEPVILGEDGLPLYNKDGSKVTLANKVKESFDIFFDKKPTQDPKLQLLNGQGKKVEISASIDDIDAKLRQAKTPEEYSALLETKENLIKNKN